MRLSAPSDGVFWPKRPTPRERLLPYLTAQAARSIATARPLMRALCFDWPDDAGIWEFPLQYLLGDDLLVAPVSEPGASEWMIYLPAEEWVDAWTGERVSGPATTTRPAPIEEIPVHPAHAWPCRG